MGKRTKAVNVSDNGAEGGFAIAQPKPKAEAPKAQPAQPKGGLTVPDSVLKSIGESGFVCASNGRFGLVVIDLTHTGKVSATGNSVAVASTARQFVPIDDEVGISFHACRRLPKAE